MNINELDEAELRYEFRKIYVDHGYDTCVQMLFELITASKILTEVMTEELQNEKD